MKNQKSKFESETETKNKIINDLESKIVAFESKILELQTCLYLYFHLFQKPGLLEWK